MTFCYYRTILLVNSAIIRGGSKGDQGAAPP